MVFKIEEGVELKVIRKPSDAPGVDDAACEIRATDGTALVKGICLLVMEAAKRMGMTKQELLCRLAVVLMNADGKEAHQ